MILGHLATAVLLKQYLPEEETVPLLIGSIFPDIGDKSIKYIGNMAQGRSLFHSLVGVIATTVILMCFARKKIVRSWLLGYLFHLLCDTGGTVPWLYPFVHYDYAYSPYSYKQKVARVFIRPKLAESALIVWATYRSIAEATGKSAHT